MSDCQLGCSLMTVHPQKTQACSVLLYKIWVGVVIKVECIPQAIDVVSADRLLVFLICISEGWSIQRHELHLGRSIGKGEFGG